MPLTLNPSVAKTAQPAGEAVCFRIGGVQVNLTPCGSAPFLLAGLTPETEFFRVRDGHPDCRISTSFAAFDGGMPGEPIFDSGSLWKLYRSGKEYIFQFHSARFGPLPYKQARFSEDFSRGEVLLQAAYFDPALPALPLEYPLDELLVMHLLALGRGVEVHACGIQDRDGRGYLFLGQSGAGKSTTARLWLQKAHGHIPGVKILSDDRIILRLEEGRVWMYGTPWHGEAELACSMRTPLTKIFFLARGADNYTVPLSQAETISRILACSFVPFYSAEALAFTLQILHQITQAVPAAEYRFVPDALAVDYIRERAA